MNTKYFTHKRYHWVTGKTKKCTHTHANKTHTSVCRHTNLYAQIQTHTHTHTHIHTHTHTYTNTHTYTHTHTQSLKTPPCPPGWGGPFPDQSCRCPWKRRPGCPALRLRPPPSAPSSASSRCQTGRCKGAGRKTCTQHAYNDTHVHLIVGKLWKEWGLCSCTLAGTHRHTWKTHLTPSVAYIQWYTYTR